MHFEPARHFLDIFYSYKPKETRRSSHRGIQPFSWRPCSFQAQFDPNPNPSEKMDGVISQDHTTTTLDQKIWT
jgi:hypothetical protein